MMGNRIKYAKKYYRMYKNRKVLGAPNVSGTKTVAPAMQKMDF